MTEAIGLFRLYFGACVAKAFRNALSSALNWASTVGVAVVGAVLQYRSRTITEPSSWIAISSAKAEGASLA